MVQAIPAGHAGVTPYLAVRDATRALEFYVQASTPCSLARLRPARRSSGPSRTSSTAIAAAREENRV